MKYDNNTIASTLLGGWIFPALASVVTVILRNLWFKQNSVQ